MTVVELVRESHRTRLTQPQVHSRAGGTTQTASARDDENSGEPGQVRVDAELDAVGDEIARPDRAAVDDGRIQTRVTDY